MKAFLRFKDCQEKPVIRYTLGKICQIVGGGTPDTSNEEYWGGDIQWFTPTEIKTNYVSTSKRTISHKGLINSSAKVLPAGTILLTTRATIGQASIALEECTTNQGFQSLICNNKSNNYYLLNWLKHNKKALIKRASGSTFIEISKSELEKITINLPLIEEQQKIADFLQKADERIALLKQKKELLERYKKGAVQKIFSQELKFKKGSRWNEIKVHEIYRNIPTNSLSRNDLNYNCGTVKNIHYGDIHTSFKSHLNTTYEKIPYINQEIKLRYTSGSYCTPGDIIFADASEDVKDIGKCVEIIEVNNDHLLAGLHTIHLRPITQLIAKGFAGYLFRSPNVVRQIQKESQGAKVLGISASKLLNLSVVIPEMHEQEMIVDFLTKLDEKIYAIEKQLKLAELWKKGLLQQMFV